MGESSESGGRKWQKGQEVKSIARSYKVEVALKPEDKDIKVHKVRLRARKAKEVVTLRLS